MTKNDGNEMYAEPGPERRYRAGWDRIFGGRKKPKPRPGPMWGLDESTARWLAENPRDENEEP